MSGKNSLATITDNLQPGFTILAEDHRNEAATRILNAAVGPNTTIHIEMQSVLNGPIEAYYQDKISKDELLVVLKGAYFQKFERRAEALTDMIVHAKAEHVPVIAYDAREAVAARKEGIPTLEHYTQRKLTQIDEERSSFNDDTESMKAMGMLDAKGVEERQKQWISRDATIRQSLTIISATNNDSVEAREIEGITDRALKNGITNTDVMAAAIISNNQAPGTRNIILAGEDHVTGEGRFNPKNWNHLSGALDESLKAFNPTSPVAIYAVRDKKESFLTRTDEVNEAISATKYNGYIEVLDGTNATVYPSALALKAAIEISDPQTLVDHRVRGSGNIGKVLASSLTEDAELATSLERIKGLADLTGGNPITLPHSKKVENGRPSASL